MADDDGRADALTRRDALKLLAGGAVAAVTACKRATPTTEDHAMHSPTPPAGSAATGPAAPPSTDPVLAVKPLGFPWQTSDPFLFCVHHDDAYPAGNERMAPPAAALVGRRLGNDFEIRDGFRMYHGHEVPGFPQHPHRGFETVTVVRRGLLDHSDSMGAAARYGRGDVQWLTAGRGILHAEMFPLVERTAPNPVELFQIWLNLPAVDKMVEPHFSMLWSPTIPRVIERDAEHRATELAIVAGRLGDHKAPPPAPSSWAARPDSDVAIWTLKLDAGARFTLPEVALGTQRTLYFYRGLGLRVGGRSISIDNGIDLRTQVPVLLENGPAEAELLLLQGRPIGEPVVNYGPFVMNTREEIRQTIAEYQRTRFGGWPWTGDDPVHARGRGRFARHADGTIDQPA